MRTNNDSDINVINNISIFYKNQVSNSYKTDERVLKEIVVRNVLLLLLLKEVGNARLGESD